MTQTTGNPPPIPHALTAPPFSPPVFLGRDQELDNLHERLFATAGDQFLLMVNGQGGMGKTSLASRYYHQHQQDYQHVAWVLSNKSIQAALLQLASGLGLDFSGSQLPPDAQLKAVIRRLADLPAPSLLVIDNANEVDDLREHFLALQQCSNLHLLLTSRITNFPTARFFRVEGLAIQYAQDLFRRHYPGHRSAEDDLLREMISAVGHNTLIIELFAKNLRQINRYEEQYTLRNLLADLQDSILLLSESEQVNTSYQAKGTSLRQQTPELIVLAMYDLRDLGDLQQQMMGIFALLPNEEIYYSDLQLLLPELNFRAALDYLTDHGWVDYDPEERSFKVNQVVQDVVRTKRTQLLRQDADLLIATVESILDADKALSKEFIPTTRRLLRFAESCLLNISHWDRKLLNLSWSVGDFYKNTGDLFPALEMYQLMSRMAEGLVQSDPENIELKYNQAVSYSKLGSTHSSLGNLSKALEYFEERSRLGEELYRSYPDNVSLKNGLAISYWKLGDFYRDKREDRQQVRHYFQQAEQQWVQLVELAPGYAQFQQYLEQVREDLAALE